MNSSSKDEEFLFFIKIFREFKKRLDSREKICYTTIRRKNCQFVELNTDP
jgi:hypothetical protein